MAEYALLDADGVVTNVIVADPEFIAALPDQIADEAVDSGELEFAKVVDVTDKGVGIGYKRMGNGKFEVPKSPPPTPEQLAAQQRAQAAADRRAADDEFLVSLADKLDAGTSLTQDERDRKDVIVARRS